MNFLDSNLETLYTETVKKQNKKFTLQLGKYIFLNNEPAEMYDFYNYVNHLPLYLQKSLIKLQHQRELWGDFVSYNKIYKEYIMKSSINYYISGNINNKSFVIIDTESNRDTEDIIFFEQRNYKLTDYLHMKPTAEELAVLHGVTTAEEKRKRLSILDI